MPFHTFTAVRLANAEPFQTLSVVYDVIVNVVELEDGVYPPGALVALTVTFAEPGAVTVPENAPVVVLNEIPIALREPLVTFSEYPEVIGVAVALPEYEVPTIPTGLTTVNEGAGAVGGGGGEDVVALLDALLLSTSPYRE